MRSIFDFPGENAKIAYCLAERGGFEPPRPFRIRGAEFNPRLAHYSARKKASVMERTCSPEIRLCLDSLRFSSLAGPMRGIGRYRTSGEGFWFEPTPPWAGSHQLNSVCSKLHDAVFAPPAALPRCAAQSRWRQRTCS